MTLEKIKNCFYRVILILLFVFVAYATYCSIFNVYGMTSTFKPIVIILGMLVTIFLFIRLRKLFDKLTENNIYAIGICIIFFLLMLIFGMFMTTLPTKDLSNIQKEVSLMLKNGGEITTEYYYSIYSNQKPLTILIYSICMLGKIFGINNIRLSGIIANSLFTSITAYFIYMIAKEKFGFKNALVTLIFFVINPIFYLYSSYFYADMMCMPFAMSAIYFFIKSLNIKSEKKKNLLIALTGLNLAIGFKIRVVVGILLIAFILYMFSKGKIKDRIINISKILVAFVIGIIICNVILNQFKSPMNKDLEFPITHWIMIGVNEKSDGRWNYEDFQITNLEKTSYEKKKTNISEIKQRIQKMKTRGIVDLLKSKINVNWAVGEYGYRGNSKNVVEINFLYNYILGNKIIFLLYYLQIAKAIMLFMYSLVVFREIFNKKIDNSYIYVSLFGAFLFYFIWEVQSRYSLSFLPWMILVFGVGVEMLQNVLTSKIIKIKINEKVRNINTEKVNKYLSFTIIFITLFLILINYNEYAVEKQLKWDKAVVQSAENRNLINKISNKKIVQTFETTKKFNLISIMMKKGVTEKETHYNFILKDGNDKVLFKQVFSSKEITNNEYKTFRFDTIRPKDNNKYKIEIYSNDATDEDSIGIASFYLENYTTYEDRRANY